MRKVSSSERGLRLNMSDTATAKFNKQPCLFLLFVQGLDGVGDAKMRTWLAGAVLEASQRPSK